MKKIFIIDAVNFLFRSYYAIGPMTNPKGESTNGLYGLIRSIYKIIKDFSPDYVAAVFDGPDNKQRRLAIYSEYKSHRVGMPEDLFPQMEKAIQWCNIAGIPCLVMPGEEADDVIGSIAKWAEKQNIKSYICTSDKDFAQLVNEHVFLINPHKDNLLIDKQQVKHIYGVAPEQIIDYLALVGDASDNIPGLEGFGPKTAADLLSKYGTLDYLLENPSVAPGHKKQETLVQGKEIALLSRKLAALHCEVDFPRNVEFFHLKEPQMDEVKAFYSDMHFLSLLKEIDTTATAQQVGARRAHTEEQLNYMLIDNEEKWHELLAILLSAKEIAIDTETTNIRPMLGRLVGVSFAINAKTAWYVPVNGNVKREKILHGLTMLFSQKSVKFYGHNIKYDLHIFLNEGLPLPSICFDTILASYLLSPQRQRHGIDELALEYFGMVKTPIEELIGKGRKQISMDLVSLEKICQYACEDVDYTCRLKELFIKEIEAQQLETVLYQIEMPLIPVLLSMERHGIYVDGKKLEKISEEFSHEIKTLQTEIYAIAGTSFNLNSPQQLSKILFEKLGIKPPKKIATGFSTSAEVLESLQESSPIIHHILEYRTVEKLRSTYADALQTQVNPSTKRIHCTFKQSVTATGRLSCQDPNLQNIPVRGEKGIMIRGAFEAELPNWSFLSGDYSQIELRLLAHLSEDPTLLKAFHEGEDIHAYTASIVFGVPLTSVTQEMRRRAKAVNFGIIYGQQAFGLSQGLGIEYKEASAFIDTYFQRYKRVKEFLEFCKEAARKTGRVVTMTGRQRPIPEITSKNSFLRAAAERLAVNTPLQGTAADLIKIAMIQLNNHVAEDPSLGFMLLQIHDELLFEVPDAHAHKLAALVKKTMEGVMHLKVPLEVHISIGKNWGEC